MKTTSRLSRFCRRSALAAIFLLFLPAGSALADDVGLVKVITQNQYLGADLTPLLLAGNDPVAVNQALIDILLTIGANNYPERVQALAQTIADGANDLIGLQEVWAFDCTPTPFAPIPDPCSYFGPAFNDHLQATLDALLDLGADYYLAAQVQNLAIEAVLFPGFPPGFPIDINLDGLPDVVVAARDRDVILARGSVVATPAPYPCVKPSLDGCNFENVIPLSVGGLEINLERGFVAVDAIVRGDAYRFVNTHLEVESPAPIVQSLQASELIGMLAAYPPLSGTRLLVVGDINSDPDDPDLSDDFPTPYHQFETAGYTDTWTLNRKESPGLTCCEAEDLLNEVSIHDRRVDMIFALDAPDKVMAKILNTRPQDKTASGLWPSDHATVAAKLKFRR